MTKKTQKEWHQLNAENSWTMFKVLSEFVEGFEKLNRIGPCVSVFGSARSKPGSKYYEMAVDIAARLCEEGYGVITGGGPGIMEAGNKGAQEAKGLSVGLNIDLPFEQGSNPYVDEDKNIDIGNFGTAVHEGLHSYDWELADNVEDATPERGDRWKSYFVNTGIVLSTEEKRVFRTAGLHRNYFPEAVKQMSRYETYIQAWRDHGPDESRQSGEGGLAAYGGNELRPGESRTTANVKGIYGLMEEFNAYHHGIKAEYELISAMENPGISGATNSLAAYFEFNVFMAYYLKYARERERQVYELLMSDKNLRIAYTLIELSWRELITQVYKNELTTNYYMYWCGEPDLLTDELRKVLDSFMIPVADLGEYQQYARSKQFDPDVKALVLRKIEEDKQRSASWSSTGDYGSNLSNWSDWDKDNNTTSSVVTIKTEPLIDGKYYVVVHVEQGMSDLIGKVREYKGQDVKIGAGAEMETFYFFIGEFKTLVDAQEFLRTNKTKYPDIRLVSWK